MANEHVEREKDFIPDSDVLDGRLKAPADRMFIVDHRSQSNDREQFMLEAQYNPQELEEELRVSWARMESPGQSHRPLHYTGTENQTFSFTLTFDGLVEGMTISGILRARRFLRAMCFPKRGAVDVASGEAPVLLFVWPNFVRVTAVISDLTFRYESFTNEGTPSRFTVGVKLEGVRDVRLYSEDALEFQGEDAAGQAGEDRW